MTIKDLEEYRTLIRETDKLGKKLEQLNNGFLHDTVKGSSHQKPFQMQIIRVSGSANGKNGTETYARVKRTLEDRMSRIRESIAEIEEFINSVEKSKIRCIIDYRYVNGMSWRATATKVYGYPCEDRARKAVTRFFANINQNINHKVTV